MEVGEMKLEWNGAEYRKLHGKLKENAIENYLHFHIYFKVPIMETLVPIHSRQ